MAGIDGDYGHQNGGLDHGGEAGGSDDGSAVFISNLQWWTTDAELEQLCAAYGHVLNIRFIDDKACGKSRGMAIVEFAEGDAAAQCIAGLNGRDLNGRSCRVSYQQQRNQPGASTSGQYGSSRGGMGSSMGGGGRGPGGGGRGRGSLGGRGGGGGGRSGGAGSMDDMAAADIMGVGMMGAGSMMGPGGIMMMPGMMPGMMGMAMPGMDMMQGMQGMMMMQGMPGMMAPFGMPGMPGFKPPPPPGGPPKKE